MFDLSTFSLEATSTNKPQSGASFLARNSGIRKGKTQARKGKGTEANSEL